MSNGKVPKEDVFGCELVINGSTYYLTKLIASDSPEADFVRGFRLEKSDAKRPGVYDVIQTDLGVSCDCPDWQIRRSGVDSLGCKHMRAMYYFGFMEREWDESPDTPGSLDERPRSGSRQVFPD
jgi:hypothetical protein